MAVKRSAKRLARSILKNMAISSILPEKISGNRYVTEGQYERIEEFVRDELIAGNVRSKYFDINDTDRNETYELLAETSDEIHSYLESFLLSYRNRYYQPSGSERNKSKFIRDLYKNQRRKTDKVLSDPLGTEGFFIEDSFPAFLFLDNHKKQFAALTDERLYPSIPDTVEIIYDGTIEGFSKDEQEEIKAYIKDIESESDSKDAIHKEVTNERVLYKHVRFDVIDDGTELEKNALLSAKRVSRELKRERNQYKKMIKNYEKETGKKYRTRKGKKGKSDGKGKRRNKFSL